MKATVSVSICVDSNARSARYRCGGRFLDFTPLELRFAAVKKCVRTRLPTSAINGEATHGFMLRWCRRAGMMARNDMAVSCLDGIGRQIEMRGGIETQALDVLP